MSKYQLQKFNNRRRGMLWVMPLIFLAAIAIAVIGFLTVYSQNIRPVSNDQRAKVITIAPGSSVQQIADQLHSEGLIKSAWALELYTYKHNLGSKFQAGSYALAPSAGTEAIAKTLTQGKTTAKLVTIIPGRRIDQVRADLINDGFTPEAVDLALQPDQYADLPIFTVKPANVQSLEGLLWPESYQKDETTKPSDIIRQSLNDMGKQLTPELLGAFSAQGISPYQGLILASIVEQEVSKPNDRAQAAQVFLKRLRTDMVLGSDVTANYGAIAAGRAPSLTYDSPYNTLIHKGLPPTPISAVSGGSLQAIAQPASTDWLYFVAGDDGITYFSKTFAEHEKLIEKHCFKLCGR